MIFVNCLDRSYQHCVQQAIPPLLRRSDIKHSRYDEEKPEEDGGHWSRGVEHHGRSGFIISLNSLILEDWK